jgi:hypothetical protein
MVPECRLELPPDVRYVKPTGQLVQGLAAPAGYVFGNRRCGKCVPLMPKYVMVICIACGRSCWMESCQFWAVPARSYRAFYRVVRRLMRQQQDHRPPLLRAGELDRLWKNTIHFLRHGRDVLKRYGVPQKRGVLLLGEPGNGKTMACRWLRGECNQHRLDWATVTAERFEQARFDGEAHQLFELRRPGIVLFDDVDIGMRSSGSAGHCGPQSTLLCGLDGLEIRQGVVYLFTSNARLDELDPAFRRPGRIDLVMEFPQPDAALRRRFISQHWHAEIAGGIDLETAVRDSDGLSFAEMDEVKKLLVLGFLENGRWEWGQACERLRSGRTDASRRRIGFVTRRDHCADSHREKIHG